MFELLVGLPNLKFDIENLRLFIPVNRARRHCRELSSACARVVAMDFCVVTFRHAAHLV